MAWAKQHVAFFLTAILLCMAPSITSAKDDQARASRVFHKHRSLTIASAGEGRQSIFPGGTQAEHNDARLAKQDDALRSSEDVSSSNVAPTATSSCVGDCTKYGTCNEELGRCDCPLGRTGPDCSQLLPEPERLMLCARNGHTNLTCGVQVDAPMCLNACNFRGRCLGGFCHCRPGFFGSDCSLSLAAAASSGGSSTTAGSVEILAGQGYTLRPSGPRIYVYELPPHMNMYQNLERLDRPLMYLLWQRWVSAGLRVADPNAADFFFVPVRVRKGYDSERMMQVVSYIRSTWPYWNATGGGERHILVHTGDWGRDELSEDMQLLTRNATWLTHWGLARDHEFAGWKQAHRPGRDIVLPLMLQASTISQTRMARASPLHPAGPRPPRRKTLFFAGRVCGSRAQPTTNGTYPNCPDVLGKEDAYSAATRQRAFFYHRGRPNWKVETRTRSYAYDMVTSKFCLAPSGAGQGKRSIMAVLMGCVPVTVTDGLLQPFEPEMRWEGFAIDVRERDIGLMHELLEGLRPDQVAQFQANLRCAAQHLFWSSMYGSVFGEDGRFDAFETLVQVLRMRAVYPTLGPEEYAYVDPAFAAFLECREPPQPGQQQGQAAGVMVPAGSRQGGASLVASVSGGLNSSSGSSARDGLGTAGTSGGTWPGMGELAKPGLQKILSSDGSRPVPRLRQFRTAAEGGAPIQSLCSHSQLPTGSGVSTCNKCVRRRGRLLNPGGTLCCNTRELAKCPRLWD